MSVAYYLFTIAVQLALHMNVYLYKYTHTHTHTHPETERKREICVLIHTMYLSLPNCTILYDVIADSVVKLTSLVSLDPYNLILGCTLLS